MASFAVEQLCRRFSLEEIRLATRDFSETHVIGEGGFGKVYKGLVDDGSLTVAIKRLSSQAQQQGETEFVAEMDILTKFRHHNLVSLIGYCIEQTEMILVYEYMPNGTLADHLHNNSSSLSWNQRLQICIGVGQGLNYLHSGCSTIHRDVKPTNILLDDTFTAKVSDFGMAKHSSLNVLKTHVISSIKGSFGYFDPNYLTTGRLTKASDTYSFGVVLLEVLSGRSAVDPSLAENELCMTRWAREKIRKRKPEQIVDPNLRSEIISPGCLKTFVKVADKCLQYEPEERLTMTQAVAQLELAFKQQQRPTKKAQFWEKYIPWGSMKRDQIEVDRFAEATPAIEEEHLDVLANQQQTVDNLQIDHNAYMLPIYVPAFPIAEIKDITDNFSDEFLIANGSGGGRVYRGVMRGGQDAAIKQLYTKLPEQEFIAQVSTISRLKHKNVVELIGYCLDGDQLRVLVYEFAPRRSLHDILHVGGKGPAMSWALRIKIAVEVAEGLLYIHEKDLIHHNISSSNVLVFDDEIAKITDLNVSVQCSCKALYRDEPYPFIAHHSSSSDYHPLECKWSNQTKEGDVYSFGVLLLELLTGRDVVEKQQHILSWAKPLLDGDKVHKIIDDRVETNNKDPAIRMAEVAHLCLLDNVDQRPNMSAVVKHLKIALQDAQPQTPSVAREASPSLLSVGGGSTSSGLDPIEHAERDGYCLRRVHSTRH